MFSSPQEQIRTTADDATTQPFGGTRGCLLLISLFLVGVFAQVDRSLPFIVAESIKSDLLLSDTQLGLVTGIAFAVCYAALSLPLARLSDRGSPRQVLVTCTLIWSVMTAIGGLATSFVFLAATRAGVAIGEAGAVPSAHALIARRIASKHRGLAIGIFSMGIPVGAMAGFGLGGAVSDAFGWRAALVGAGVLGILVALLALAAAGPTPALGRQLRHEPAYLRSSLKLLSSPDFRWLFAGAVALGFAAAPFYAFTAPFLIRTHGFSATEAGLAFGLLQGVIGIAGTVIGGRGFDRAVRSEKGLLRLPALIFMLASATVTAALVAPRGWLSMLLMAPAMFAFTFVLPYAFGSAHIVAGKGKEAMASSLALIGTGLFGPALGPLLVGIISDWAMLAGMSNSLGLGLSVVPIACLLTAAACLIANDRVAPLVRGITAEPDVRQRRPSSPAR